MWCVAPSFACSSMVPFRYIRYITNPTRAAAITTIIIMKSVVMSIFGGCLMDIGFALPVCVA